MSWQTKIFRVSYLARAMQPTRTTRQIQQQQCHVISF